MATTKVRAPSGEVMEIQHPEGATKAMILGYAKAQLLDNTKAWDGAEKYKRQASENSINGGVSGALQNTAAGFAGALPVAIGVGVKGIFGANKPGEVQDWQDSMRGLNSSIGGKVGSFAGSAAPLVAASMAPGGMTVLGSAAAGMANSAVQPVGDGESRAGNMVRGGLFNAAVPAGIAMAKTGAAVVAPVTHAGQEAIAGRVLGRFASDPASLRLATTGRSMSGTWPTLAENTGDLGLANLQNILQSRDTRALIANRFADNNAARIGALDNMGGTDAQLATALERRKSIGKLAYDRANSAGVDQGMAKALQPQIDNLLERPAVKTAIEAAKKKAGNEGIHLSDFGSPQGLKYLKQELDDMALSMPKGSNDARIYSQIASDFDGVLREIVPDIKQADKVYARLSREPNRMQTARELQSETTSALRDFNGDPRLYAEKYARTLDRGAERTVKEATGMKRKTLGEIMSPSDMAMLEDIRKTAERQAAAQRPRVSGSPTAKNLIGDDIVGRIAGPVGIPQSWAQSALADNFLARPASWALKSSEERLGDVLTRGLLDPAYATQLVDRAIPGRVSRVAGRALTTAAPVYQGAMGGLLSFDSFN